MRRKELPTAILFFVIIACFFVVDKLTEEAPAEQNESVKKNQTIKIKPNEDIIILTSPEEKLLSSEENTEDIKFECDTDLSQLADLGKFSEPNAIQNAFKANENYTTQLAYALSANTNELTSNESTKAEAEKLTILLSQLLKQEPDNKLTNYVLATKCSDTQFQAFCDENTIKQIINNDASNGALWFQIAILQANKNDIDAVTFALQQMIIATHYNEYWGETIELFDKAQELIGINQKIPRMVSSIGFGAAVSLSSVGSIFKFCKEKSESRADIAQLCVDAGERLAAHSKTQINHGFGNGLQKSVYEVIKDEQNLARIKIQQEAFSKLVNESFDGYLLMGYDAELMAYWFEQLKLFGEVEASRLLVEEVTRLTSDPDYNPCSS